MSNNKDEKCKKAILQKNIFKYNLYDELVLIVYEPLLSPTCCCGVFPKPARMPVVANPANCYMALHGVVNVIDLFNSKSTIRTLYLSELQGQLECTAVFDCKNLPL